MALGARWAARGGGLACDGKAYDISRMRGHRLPGRTRLELTAFAVVADWGHTASFLPRCQQRRPHLCGGSPLTLFMPRVSRRAQKTPTSPVPVPQASPSDISSASNSPNGSPSSPSNPGTSVHRPPMSPFFALPVLCPSVECSLHARGERRRGKEGVAGPARAHQRQAVRHVGSSPTPARYAQQTRTRPQ